MSSPHGLVASSGRAPGVAIAGLISLALLACGPSGDAPDRMGTLELDSTQMRERTLEMLATADILDRHRKAIRLLDALDADNLEGALSAYEENLAKVEPHEARLIANAWAAIDARGAIDRVLSNWRYPKVTNAAALEIVYEWAQQGDGAEARAYVDPSLEGPIESPRSPTKFMVAAVLKALAVAQQWEQLTGLFGSIEDSGDREFWLTQVLIEVNRAHEFEVMKQWIDSIPWDAPNRLKLSAVARAIAWGSRSSFENATTWYEEVEDHPQAVELLPHVVTAEGVLNPANALAWLRERKEGDTQINLMREILFAWFSRSGEDAAAIAWVEEHEDDARYRLAFANPMIRYWLGRTEFEKAAAFATKYPVESMSAQTLARILSEWTINDEDGAKAFIASADLSEDLLASYRMLYARKMGGVRTIRERIADGAPAESDAEKVR